MRGIEKNSMPPLPAEGALPCSSKADPTKRTLVALESSKCFFHYKKSWKSYNYWQPSVSIHETLANVICRWGHLFLKSLYRLCTPQPACFAHPWKVLEAPYPHFSYSFTVIVCTMILLSQPNKHWVWVSFQYHKQVNYFGLKIIYIKSIPIKIIYSHKMSHSRE